MAVTGMQAARAEIQQRLATLCAAIPEGERNEFQRGQVAALQWAVTEIDGALESLLPPGMSLSPAQTPGLFATEEESRQRFDAVLATPLPFTAMPRFSVKACLAERTHAYVPQTPVAGQKRCQHCGDTQPMNHGEKIAHGKRQRKIDHDAWYGGAPVE
jgi:hypothetical protein